ncbi:hypothetical protein D6777_04295 [Candidatus Woesearchaeota archaeon]|nr:MAG: hypothetical protein D6777_04295 [Candidatus Woesearchaeota archaeon]
MLINYKRFSAMDDSTSYMKIDKLNIHVYISVIANQNNNSYLAIIKPAEDTKNKVVRPVLSKWLKENVEEKLVACSHYHDYYPWLKKEFDVDFINRKLLKKYSQNVVNRFLLADEDARQRTRLARAMFSEESEHYADFFKPNNNYHENIEVLLNAIKKGNKILDLGIVFNIVGW